MLAQRWFGDLAPTGLAYARLLGLDKQLDQDVAQLSGGERQRLVLARQLGLSPSLLLLDECTANLGWLHVQTIEKELIRLKEGGTCIVIATHNIPQAHRIADNVIVLREGESVPLDDPFAVSMLKGEWIEH